jgi:hypothetical protein
VTFAVGTCAAAVETARPVMFGGISVALGHVGPLSPGSLSQTISWHTQPTMKGLRPKAIMFDTFGGPEVLYVADVPVPNPGPQQCESGYMSIPSKRGGLLRPWRLSPRPCVARSRLGTCRRTRCAGVGCCEVHDPGRDLQPCFDAGAEPVPVDVLHLDGRVECLAGGVAQCRADPARRLQPVEATAGGLEGLGGVLLAARSEWKITPSMVPPRMAAAIRSEATASSAS